MACELQKTSPDELPQVELYRKLDNATPKLRQWQVTLLTSDLITRDLSIESTDLPLSAGAIAGTHERFWIRSSRHSIMTLAFEVSPVTRWFNCPINAWNCFQKQWPSRQHYWRGRGVRLTEPKHSSEHQASTQQLFQQKNPDSDFGSDKNRHEYGLVWKKALPRTEFHSPWRPGTINMRPQWKLGCDFF